MKSTPTNASTDGPLSYTSSDSTDTSRNTEPPRNLKAAGRVFITNPTAPLIGTFVIDPHKTAPRLPNYPSSPIQKKEPTNPLSQDRPNLHLVGTDDVIDVTVWLVESQVKISRTRTRIVMTQTKEQPITAQINRCSPTPSSVPCPPSHPTPFIADVRSHGLVHLSIPRNYHGPLKVLSDTRPVLSTDIQSVVTDWYETVETSDEQEGNNVVQMSCFLGDWDEGSNGEDESGGEDKQESGWKYDELEVAGHSVIVQYVDEDTETIREFEFGERFRAQTNGSTSAPTSTSPLRSFLSAGVYRIRSTIEPELCIEMQDDDVVLPVPLNESRDEQKWRIVPREGGDDYDISNIKDNKILSIETYEPGKSIPSGKYCYSNPRSHWLIEPRLDTFIISIPGDGRVLDLSDGYNMFLVLAGFLPIECRRQQRWFIEPIILNTSASVADGRYVICNRGQDCYWHAGTNPIQTVRSYFTPLTNARSRSYTTWSVTHDASGNLLIQSPHAPTSRPAASLNGSQTPVPWRCIPESPGSKWHYLTTDMASSVPQVATTRPDTLNHAGFFTQLKEGDWNQMWEFVSI